MLVNKKMSNDNSVILLERKSENMVKDLITGKLNFPLSYRLGILLRSLIIKLKYIYKSFLIEKFYPFNSSLKEYLKYKADIIHFHDGQANSYDVKTLKKLSQLTTVVFSLHDLWLFTGHCGVPLDCDKFKTLCGDCPDLLLPPKIHYDNTRLAVKYKHDKIIQSDINFLAHSNWVKNKIDNLEHFKNKIKFDFIQYSIDIEKFKPRNKEKIREKYTLSKNSYIIMTNAVGISSNPYKDFNTLEKAFQILTKEFGKDIFIIIVGEKDIKSKKNSNKENFLFFNPDPQSDLLIDLYAISDLYVHSSNIETWGLAISEALSCGIPVIASSVGAISEQVYGLDRKHSNDKLNKFTIEDANGFLFERKNTLMLFEIIKWIILNEATRHQLSKNARKYAVKRLNMNKDINLYTNYYEKILKNKNILKS